MAQNRNKDISLLGLFGKETFEEFQKKMAKATHFSFSIIDYKGSEVVPGYYQKEYKEFLRQIGEDHTCQMSSAFAAAKAAITNLPYIYLCQCGLIKIAIPIVVNEQYLGAVLCGHVYCEDIDYMDEETNLSIIQKDFPMNAEKAEHLFSIPVISAEQIKANADMIFYVMKELCKKETFALQAGNVEHNRVHLQDLRNKNNNLQKKVDEYELTQLMAKMHPQSLLNMLVTISNTAIVEDAIMTQDIVEIFSSILRYYVEDSRTRISLNEEFQQINHYLNVFKLRYENKFDVEIHPAESLNQLMIPKLIMLPLVQYVVNLGALKHNFNGRIICSTELISARCVFTIRFEHDEDAKQVMGYLNESGNVIDERMFHDQIGQLEKRIGFAYPNDYKLSITEEMIVLDIPANIGKE